ncbi:50S ribosomal protein L25/general stress protein Ctc [Moorena sp. SIO4G3]
MAIKLATLSRRVKVLPMNVTVECQKRPEGSKPRALRRSGLIPTVLYGHNGAESVSLTMTAKAAEDLLKTASVNNTLIELSIPDLSWNGPVLLREIQSHPWKNSLYHLSFFSVASQNKVEVVVPLKLVGEAVGVKQGGVLQQRLTTVKVQCPPDKIPESIDIDISNLEQGKMFYIYELVLPEGIQVMDDPKLSVLAITSK